MNIGEHDAPAAGEGEGSREPQAGKLAVLSSLLKKINNHIAPKAASPWESRLALKGRLGAPSIIRRR